MLDFEMLSLLFQRYPLFGQILTAGFFTVVGDALAQHGLEKRKLGDHDWRRTLKLAIYGFGIIGPAAGLWFRFLDSRVLHHHPGIQTAKRVAMDQLIFAPLFLGIFFLYNGLFDQLSRPMMIDRFHHAYLPALKANYKVWPIVQIATFWLIPLPFRIAFVNIVALGWNVYLCHLNARDTNSKAEQP